jgi:transcription initiation factor TFIIIB Brf1 subunit/transcription initiation factor TFIIB
MSMFTLMQQAIKSESEHRLKQLKKISGKEEKEGEEDTDYKERCPHCNSDFLCHKNLDVVCMDCGVNLGSDIDHGPEWRNDKNTGEDMSRCNLTRNDMLPESSLSTCISVRSNAPKIDYDLQRTMTWNGVPHNERSLRNKMDEISYICQTHDIPGSIVEYAQHQYYDLIKALETNNLTRKRGKNDSGMKAAAIFIAFQDDEKPRTYKDIAKLFSIEPKYVSEGITLFYTYVRPNGKVTIYSDYIEEFCRNMNLGQTICDRVTDIADKADSLGILENNTPTSIVAGCIYYVAVEFALPIKPGDVATSCGVSGPTINKVSNKLFNRAMDLVDDGDGDGDRA